MKALPVAIALSLLSSLLPLVPASARPLEPDLLCYMRTPSGRVINLASLCEGNTLTTAKAPQIITVTLAQYNQIQKGMTYDQVAQIFQSPGFKFSDREEEQGFRATKYSWTNFDQSKAFIDFSNGIVVSKLQSDLK